LFVVRPSRDRGGPEDGTAASPLGLLGATTIAEAIVAAGPDPAKTEKPATSRLKGE